MRAPTVGILSGLMLAAGMQCHGQQVEPVTITMHPMDQVVEAGRSATFQVQATGTAPRYQWFTNGAKLVSATNAIYTTPGTTPAMSGIAFHVVVSNLVNVSTSRAAMLTVIPDTTGPHPLAAYTVSANRLEARFDERLLLSAGVLNVTNFSIFVLGATNTIRVTNVFWGSNVLRMTANQNFSPTGNYALCMSNVMDSYTNVMWPNPACLPIGILKTNLLISGGEVWRFREGGALEGAWTMLNYEDDPEAPPYHWTEGWGTFWSSSSPGFRSCWPHRTSLSIGPITYYFRRRFVVSEAPGTNSSLVLNHFIDDGAVFYLNGREIHRVRMPTGPVDPSTRAVHVSDAGCTTSEMPVGDVWMPGTNIMAVEVHQAVETSPQLNDVAFDLDLKVKFYRTPAIPAVNIVYRNGDVLLTWESGWALETAETLSGPWVKVVTSGSEYLSPVGEVARRFFRLANP